MTTTTISTLPDNWNNFYTNLISNYKPTSVSKKLWNELKFTFPKINKNDKQLTNKPIPNEINHLYLPCANQHKPYGTVTKPVYSPFEDDDRPDWHHFNHNYKPTKLPVSEEIEEEVIL